MPQFRLLRRHKPRGFTFPQTQELLTVSKPSLLKLERNGQLTATRNHRNYRVYYEREVLKFRLAMVEAYERQMAGKE